jgi:hypothetical protein
MKISLKNKPNTKPIQTQFWPKNQGGKANQSQNKPNLVRRRRIPKIDISSFLTSKYEGYL